MKFEAAVEIILKLEAGYSNDPKDAGGETNFGISKRAYPDLDIKNLTVEEAKEIYKKDYWDKVKADRLPDLLRLPVFDSAVNQGVGAAIKMLQKCAGVEQDGVLGEKSFAEIEKQDHILEKFIKARISRYNKSDDWVHFGLGWVNRVIEIIFKNGVA